LLIDHMEPLVEYAEHWLKSTVLWLGRPFDLEQYHRRVEDIETARPGFAAALRLAALHALTSDERRTAYNTVGALAVVGMPEDVERLRSLVGPFSGEARLIRDARTAIFEITHGRSLGAEALPGRLGSSM
jgi:hypothetical protein